MSSLTLEPDPTGDPIKDRLAHFSPPEPAYVRLPRWGAREPNTGLTRTALDLLTRPQEANNFRPPVKSKILKQTGQKQGIKLIDFRSLRIYLDGLPDGALSPNKPSKK